MAKDSSWERWFEATLDFSKWLCLHSGYNDAIDDQLDPNKHRFSYSDRDGLFWQYKNNTFRYFQVEQKTLQEKRKEPQQKAFQQFDAIYRVSDNKTICGYKNIYLGSHLLQISGTNPDDSNIILWNKNPIQLQELFEILRFERSPEFKGAMRNIGPKYWELKES